VEDALSGTARIESLDHEGQGVARVNDKVVFVRGALPGETVTFSVFRKKPSFELANIEAVVKPSSQRISPRCAYFEICGGCSLQHLDEAAQVAVKQRVLEDALRHIGKVEPDVVLPAIHGQSWGYRTRARLAVRWVEKKRSVLAGFHEKRSSFIADMRSCEVLAARVSELLVPLREMLGQLAIRNRVPQIEVAMTDDRVALALRILDAPSQEDKALLHRFAEIHGVDLYLQPGGPESTYPFSDTKDLNYSLPEFDVKLTFGPNDFTQVNPAVNRVLVRRAVSLLDPKPADNIADLFCGIGNFSLPIARMRAAVSGFEGSAPLVERAKLNAKSNGFERNAQFFCRDLFVPQQAASFSSFSKILLDPPRDGAIETVKVLGEQERIVYVSCNPATLARDASVLVHNKGYRLTAVGVINMFPHTAHVESIALFAKE
jgi:23S rRNA (uracil1939-C5)-methyltransferase